MKSDRQVGAKQDECTSARRLLWICLLAGISCFACVHDEAFAQRAMNNAAILVQAKILVQNNDPEGALAVLERADLKGKEAADVLTMKGICLAITGKPVESAAQFDLAIARRPAYAPTYLSAGLAFASFNNLDLAMERLAKALELDPHLPGARYNYALVLARAGKFAESEREVDRELAIKGARAETDADLWRLKARDIFYQKKWPETLQAYSQVLSFEPQSAEAYAALGEALFSLNRSEESERALKRAIALDPTDGASHALLGKLYQARHNNDAAIAELTIAYQLRPNDRESIYRLFRLYLAKGDTMNSTKLKQQLDNLLSNNRAESDNEAKAVVFNNTGIDLEKKGSFSEALDNYDQAARTNVVNIVYQRNAALLLCRMGRTQEAIRRLNDILTLDEDDVVTLQILAVAKELAAGDISRKTHLPAAEASR